MRYLKSELKNLVLMISNIKYLSRWIILVADIFLSALATFFVIYSVAIFRHVDLSISQSIILVGVSLFSTLVAALMFKTYANVIRHATLRENWRLFVTVLVKDLIFLAIILAANLLMDNNVLLILVADFFVTTVLLLFVRIVVLNMYNILLLSTYTKRKNILVYGTSDESVILAQGGSKVYMQDHIVCGFLTTNLNKRNLRIASHPVYYIDSEDELKRLAVAHNVEGILFPSPKQAQKEEKRLLRYCENVNLRILVVPNMEEIKGSEVHRSIRRINIEDLLGRDEIQINMKEIGSLLQGKSVLVTGAAGSIGSELCCQLATFGVKQLILFDNAETPMHNLRLELEERFPDLDFVPIIGDVRILARLDFAFRKYRPAVVFHAAAYKHVPLMEENPCEAVLVNVAGSRNVADKCIQYGVEKMVMVSTDKAVNPTNIMGCTKRLAEIYVQALGLAVEQHNMRVESGKMTDESEYSQLNTASGDAANSQLSIVNCQFPNRVIKTKFVTTRFGNVLGSNGSVIPRFREQIAKGGPVTVTHKDITRFFMTIPEACRLVMEAATMTDGNQIFVFDMGESVKIADMARRMIKLAGFVPDKDIMIEYTGLRPGEKLYEEVLATNENTIPTGHSRIRIAKVREYDYAEARVVADELEVLSRAVEIPDMVRLMKRTVPEFKSKNSIYEEYDRELEAQAVPLDQAEYYDKDGNHVYYDRKIIKAEQQ